MSHLLQAETFVKNELDDTLLGLCRNCDLASRCAYRKTTDKIIIQCEQYVPSHSANGTAMHIEPSGLCSTCSNVKICELPGRDVGVWHCEEYK